MPLTHRCSIDNDSYRTDTDPITEATKYDQFLEELIINHLICSTDSLGVNRFRTSNEARTAIRRRN